MLFTVRKIFEVASSPDGEVSRYTIIRKLVDIIFAT
jgi:hypothetical protein